MSSTLRKQPSSSPAVPPSQAPSLEDVKQGKAVLQVGMRGGAVQEVQKLLVWAGHLTQAKMNTGPGIFGPATQAAVSSFQRAHHIPPLVGKPSGTVHKPTLEALYKFRQPGQAKGTSGKGTRPLRKEEEDDSIFEAVWNWLWGTLQGDFNKDPSLSQIAVNTLLGLVPLVDQALDVRDIVAGSKDLIEYYLEDTQKQKRHQSVLGLNYELWLWVNLFIIALGCIPEVGSVIKGVLRVLIESLQKFGKKAGGLTPKQLQGLWVELVLTLKRFGIPEKKANEWLKQLPSKLNGWMNEAALKLKSGLGTIQRLLSQAELLASSRLSRWTLGEKKFREVLSSIRGIQEALKKVYGQLEGMKVQVNLWIREQISKLINSTQPVTPKPATPKPSSPPPAKPPKQPPAPKLPKSLDELYPLLSDKARKAFDQQQQLMAEQRFQQMSNAYKNPDGTYDPAKANAFFEKKFMDDDAFANALRKFKDGFVEKTKEQLRRIKNSVEETNGTNRPGSTLGNGTTEEALIEEIATGTPYKCNDGHHGKVNIYIETLEDAIDKLGTYRKYIDDPKLLADLDAAIKAAQQRIQSMKPAMKKWNQRATTHPSIWNSDGTSKVKPGWPKPPPS